MPAERANARLETFCDGVFAIALTLLVLELHAPAVESVQSADELWTALRHLLPSVMAMLLSFIVILINWVNHHGFMKFVDKSSAPFIYANGFLLLSVVLLPFPTALLAEFGFTHSAPPAVMIYGFVSFLTGVGWVLMTSAALRPKPLTINAAATADVQTMRKRGWAACGFYLACTAIAFWFPLTIAVTLSIVWITWLVVGINVKAPEAHE